MGQLKLIDGQFMRDGKVVPPEIGNKEQIALLKQWEREQEEAEEHGLHAECMAENVEYTPTITFRCLCGHTVNDEKPTEYLKDDQWFASDDTGADWEGETVACDKCGREYVIKNGRAMLPESNEVLASLSDGGLNPAVGANNNKKNRS